MNLGNFPIDLVLFALIAALLVLRLCSVLGRRTGFEQPPTPRPMPRNAQGDRFDPRNSTSADPLNTPPNASQTTGPVAGFSATPRDGKVIDGVAESATRALPEPGTPAANGLAAIRMADRGFDPTRFISGAEQAFRTIVTAFAAGDRTTLQPLLTPETFHAFDAAITEREQARHTQHSDIRDIPSVTITQAGLQGVAPDLVASITVRFVSDQINVTTDTNGKPITGVEAVMEIADLWTFERVPGTPDPTWKLAEARIA